MNSNIEHILLTKHRCFQEITKNCFQNGVLNVSKFIQFMLGDNNIQTVSANQDYTSSISLEPSLIGRQSYSTMLEKLSTVSDEPEGYGLLKHSSLTKCLAKIYGKTTPEVLNLDKLIRIIEIRQTKSTAQILKSSELYQTKIHDYIVMIRIHVRALKELIEKVDPAIVNLSKKCDDEIIEGSETGNDICSNNEVYQLNVFKVKRDVMEFVKSSLEFESLSNLHILEGLDKSQ